MKNDDCEKMDLSENRKTHFEISMVKRPNVNNTPSIFTIDHILNDAGIKRKDNIPTDSRRFDHAGFGDRQQHSQEHKDPNCLENGILYPKMLDWLQYTRYRPPRLQRKLLHILGRDLKHVIRVHTRTRFNSQFLSLLF